ncbi:hypothetical protein G5C60_24035 [Streptomyces sp. HC44]|uniref:Oligopeptide/dipeptide ABC transporter C-terminal domain-containing protein n=1 Tax=Streptomyces scabichelini TaxID=2711217 RepID=A0A6G4V929_9ACTN|nr:hypothetical protein [Streptomyces scabichelini]NGO10579.1 hypothetical protein [Streptomyces scabichelini]
MCLGRIVERGDARAVFDTLAHPYTKALLAAAPVPDPRIRDRRAAVLDGARRAPVSPRLAARVRPALPAERADLHGTRP